MRGNERGLHVNHVTPFVLEVNKELGGILRQAAFVPQGGFESLLHAEAATLNLKGGENNG